MAINKPGDPRVKFNLDRSNQMNQREAYLNAADRWCGVMENNNKLYTEAKAKDKDKSKDKPVEVQGNVILKAKLKTDADVEKFIGNLEIANVKSNRNNLVVLAHAGDELVTNVPVRSLIDGTNLTAKTTYSVVEDSLKAAISRNGAINVEVVFGNYNKAQHDPQNYPIGEPTDKSRAI